MSLTSEFQNRLIQQFNKAPVTRTFGLSLEYNAEGEAICRLPRNPNLDHGGHDTHGGIIATLLDNAGWFTVAAKYGQPVLTSDIHVRMLQPAKQQDLVATAKIVRTGSRIAVTEMKVVSAKGELVAVATASFMKIEAPAPQ